MGLSGGGTTIGIEYFDDIGKLQADPRAAAALAQARTPFDRPDWWQLLALHCGMTPCIALYGAGEQSLVWPLASDGKTATAMANFYSFTARPLTARPEALSEGLLAIARDLRARFARVRLDHVPDEQGEAAAVHAALEQAGWSVWAGQDDINHVLDVAGRDFDAYLAARPGRLRTTLSRKARKLRTRISHAPSAADWAHYERIYAASWKPEEASQDFWRNFCQREGEAGRLRFGMAFREDEPIAAQIWTIEHGTAFIHKLAHLPGFDALSPGTVLTAALMRQAIDGDRVALVDFGTGDDRYKRDWMERQRPRYRIDALDPARPANWARIAKRKAQARLVGAEKPRYRRADTADGASMAATTANDVTQVSPDPASAEPAIDAKLRAVLADVLGLDAERVATFEAETGLFGHLPELDSQAVATLLTEIEDRFDIVIDDEDVDGEMLETYGGLRSFVRAKCDAAA